MKFFWAEIPDSHPRLFRRFVIAGGATGLAIHEAVRADADVENSLAEAAVLLAFAAVFGLFALCAAISGGTGCGAHGANVARGGRFAKVTEVIKKKGPGARDQRLEGDGSWSLIPDPDPRLLVPALYNFQQ
jgi:hypothetical protein